MTIFGDWLRQRARNISRAVNGDNRAAAQLANQAAADPLGVDLEATRQALLANIRAEEQRRVREAHLLAREAHLLAQERKEQSIMAALVFGCSCGGAFDFQAAQDHHAGTTLPQWLRAHSACAGLGSMVRENA